MNKLSVAIITLNEEENIGRCIESVKNIADELLVLDSFSTDKTCEIARSLGARVEQHGFDNYVNQRNRALELANNAYVLSMDADEYLSTGLQQSIAAEKQNFRFDAYSMNRLNFYCGQPVKSSGWYPDEKLRLWNKEKGRWGGLYIHETPELEAGSTIGHLKGDLMHNTFPTPQSYLQQVEKFSTIRARELKDKNLAYLIYKMAFSPPFKFIRTYFFNLGLTDGTMGYIICANQAREVFLKYYKAIKFKRGIA